MIELVMLAHTKRAHNGKWQGKITGKKHMYIYIKLTIFQWFWSYGYTFEISACSQVTQDCTDCQPKSILWHVQTLSRMDLESLDNRQHSCSLDPRYIWERFPISFSPYALATQRFRRAFCCTCNATHNNVKLRATEWRGPESMLLLDEHYGGQQPIEGRRDTKIKVVCE